MEPDNFLPTSCLACRDAKKRCVGGIRGPAPRMAFPCTRCDVLKLRCLHDGHYRRKVGLSPTERKRLSRAKRSPEQIERERKNCRERQRKKRRREKEEKQKTTIYALGGEPACGKTTLFRNLIPHLAKEKRGTEGKKRLVHWYQVDDTNCYFIGKGYRTEESLVGRKLHGGTCQLCRTVCQPFINWVLEDIPAGSKVFLEGARLFTQKMFRELQDKVTIKAVIITASEEALQERHQMRNDNQTRRSNKARKTQLMNIRRDFPHLIPDHNVIDTSALSKGEVFLKVLAAWKLKPQMPFSTK